MKTMKNGFVFLISLTLTLALFSLPKNGLAQEINDYSSDFTIELVPIIRAPIRRFQPK